ncbi:polyprenyl synthetase family protein [Demequina sp.]|uniref:polyprenyl synthetase family protein n=1 Tax=Demequina sp. TaxID=2050685 RepID=UPI003D0CD3F7
MPPADSALLAVIEDAIGATIAQTRATAAPAGDVGMELVDAVEAAVAGGKRLRALAVMSSYAAHGGDSPKDIAPVAAALELFQAAALVHDDVLDDAHTRRGRPTSHIAFAKAHAARGDEGNAERFGLAGAVLTGDLSLMVAMRAIAQAQLGEHGAATMRLFTEMTELVTVGQYLDMRIAASPLTELPNQLDAIRATMRSKTASYTAEFPLALGASAARGDGPHVDAARAAGVPAGIAFQLRDDLLGLTGSPAVTGKPVGDDIREGKRTVPLWHAWTRTDATGRAVIETALGEPSATEQQVQAAIDVITDTGAIDAVEHEIAELMSHVDGLVSHLDVSTQGREQLAALLSGWGARAS